MPAGSETIQFVHPLLRARDWQERPQLEVVCRWWAAGAGGVCSLVGIGGAGKTAIVDRFLQLLPGVLAVHPAVPKRKKLPAPSRLFVFSFYEAPNPDSFFHALSDFLISPSQSLWSSENAPASFQQTLHSLQKGGPCMLVLDGLEKVQDDGARGGIFGEFQDARLSDLLVRAAEGYLPEVSVLVTSRFPLAKLDELESHYYCPVDVEEIDSTAAAALLRRRGVRGSDDQLRDIATDCGCHALTVDLVGGFISEFGDGKPSTPLSLTHFEDIEQARREEPVNIRRRQVRLQEYRFARIAQSYREKLKEHDPAALALLERVCLFRLGVTAEMLATIFTGAGAGKERISGASLVGLGLDELQKTLERLVAMKLLESGPASGGPFASLGKPRLQFAIHPAVRDGFLVGLDADTRRKGHEAAREGLGTALADRPGVNPSDPATLDLLEEIVHHAIQAGHVVEAWNVYHDRMGGCRNLLARLNDYGRVARVTQMILRACGSDPGFPDRESAILRSDFGYSSLELGKLAAAVTSLSEGFELCQRTKSANLGTLARNLSYAQFCLGRLGPAIETLRLAVASQRDAKRVLDGLISIADLEAYRGTLQTTVTEEDITQITGQKPPPAIANSLPITVVNGFLGRDLHAELVVHVESLRGECPARHSRLASALLDLGESHLYRGEFEAAAAVAAEACEWGMAHDAREVSCRCALVQSRIAVANATCNPGSESNAGLPTAELASSKDRRGLGSSEAAVLVDEGLRIARDCGFGIYHIDLLLERARLQLILGDPQAAIADIRIALDDGLRANDITGQPELLAATHADCGYVWSVPVGLHLRGEALLIQAAHCTIRSTTAEELTPFSPNAQQLIDEAEACLREALHHWQLLRDPGPCNANFVHPATGAEYNYRAAETYFFT